MNAVSTKLMTMWMVLAAAAGIASAEVRVDRMFSDHMVLQREMAVPVWGTAAPGEKVTVAFAGQTRQTVADAGGKWIVRLAPLKLGKPGTLTVNTVTFTDVLVGDVWVGSGQSNMAGGTGGYAKGDDVLAATLKGGPYPQLRLYQGSWKIADEQTASRFSAIHFAFGQALQAQLGVPVGLVVGAVGGTPSGRWLSPEMLEADAACQALLGKGVSKEEQRKKYEVALAAWERAAKLAKEQGKRAPRRPRRPFKAGDLYASRIQPVVPYGIRGVLWDQGESGTAVREIDQFTMMGALIKGWRKAWGQGEFPFLYVQKSSGGGCAWDATGTDPITRMANKFTPQPSGSHKADGDRRALHIRIMQHPNTAMVSASDLGSGVHPRNKSGYGKRACRVALGFVYGKDVAIYGPTYDSHKVDGEKFHISFKHVGKGLAFRNGEKLQGFEIVGDDGTYHWADAVIVGKTVVLSSPKVDKPVAARYGWARTHTWANLFNKDGLPALMFTTVEH